MKVYLFFFFSECNNKPFKKNKTQEVHNGMCVWFDSVHKWQWEVYMKKEETGATQTSSESISVVQGDIK